MQRTQFTLPLMPVPLSACFVNVARNGRKDSPRYKAWKEATDAALAKGHCPALGTPYRATFTGDVRVAYTVKRPDRRIRDLGNLDKALSDSLTRNFIVKDDSQIVDLRIRWGEGFEGAVLVEIEAVRDVLGIQVAA